MHIKPYRVTMPEDKIKLLAGMIKLVLNQNLDKMNTETFVKYCSLMGRLAKESGMSRDDLVAYTKDLENRFDSNHKLRII